jgi:hypothetical protein
MALKGNYVFDRFVHIYAHIQPIKYVYTCNMYYMYNNLFDSHKWELFYMHFPGEEVEAEKLSDLPNNGC